MQQWHFQPIFCFHSGWILFEFPTTELKSKMAQQIPKNRRAQLMAPSPFIVAILNIKAKLSFCYKAQKWPQNSSN